MATPSLPATAPTATMEPPLKPVIVFDNVSIAFEEHVVLDGISFTLPYGETKAIFGVAGSGKSTLLKMALGLVKPDSGHIYTLGEDVTAMTEDQLFELRRNVGIVFQESALFDSLTVRENVAFRLMEEAKTPAEEIERRVREALRFVELENTVDMFPAELSGGMRRRVAIARAIITQPETLLYDSPTGGLDPVTSTTIVELIVKQRDVSKTSSLLVTHRLQDAFIMANHYFDAKVNQMKLVPAGGKIEAPMAFLMLHEGRVIFDGNIEELAHTKNEYIREYIS
jgi:phospholipid/cholesterol/gamma-HCH transport system ATP-binding protein